MLRTNPEGAARRAMSSRLRRRTYRVAGPNSLWHLDGNHKLIRWNIVLNTSSFIYIYIYIYIHIYIKYFREASNNNRSSTVMEKFVEAVDQYGVQSRVRCDQGGENNAVCLFMEVFRGSDRGSALRGRSTHNQQIERLWGDVWRGVVNVYHSLFTLLEDDGVVDCNNERHLWALHQWNHHRLRTARYMSPYQIFVRGCLCLQAQNLTGIQGVCGADEQPAQLEAEVPHSPQVPTFNWPDSVEVPLTEYTLDNDRLGELQQLVDPLGGPRDNLGPLERGH
ncbi:hypothetical protein PO909_002704 [Leuciscus waleckii]